MTTSGKGRSTGRRLVHLYVVRASQVVVNGRVIDPTMPADLPAVDAFYPRHAILPPEVPLAECERFRRLGMVELVTVRL